MGDVIIEAEGNNLYINGELVSDEGVRSKAGTLIQWKLPTKVVRQLAGRAVRHHD